MLSQQTMDIVKSTAPILDQHAETLTRHFYKRMFSHNPEVVSFFNPAHQHSGAQQRALAGAICAYAANIDNLEVLGGAVELIAQKHASLMIKSEHYPIVGANLLASIREVLGEGATDDVVNAWAEAYGFLADILIGREAQIYKEQAQASHGWQGFSNFRVIRKEKESDIITSFYLVPANGSALPLYKPGQYITVRVPTPCGHTTMRNYSLSDKPGQDYFRISVKRETGPKADTPQGYVSHVLHDQIDVNAVIEVGPPCGEFFLDTEAKHSRPLVLLGAGIGITAILSIAQAALEKTPDRKIVLVHASLHESVQAFRNTLDDLAAKHKNLILRHCYSEQPPQGVVRDNDAISGMIDASLIESLVPERDADYYFCGPKPFMVDIYYQLLSWGIPPAQVHFEFFGPRQELERQAA
jgi:nitric oxide dioxygenase